MALEDMMGAFIQTYLYQSGLKSNTDNKIQMYDHIY
jgi:hypothetical protein